MLTYSVNLGSRKKVPVYLRVPVYSRVRGDMKSRSECSSDLSPGKYFYSLQNENNYMALGGLFTNVS